MRRLRDSALSRARSGQAMAEASYDVDQATLDVLADVLDIRREEDRIRTCEICGRAAQQMGTEARCAEHDSEKETGR